MKREQSNSYCFLILYKHLIPMDKAQIKNELFTSMKELGFQDELKKQLRTQLCQKLKQKDLIKGEQPHEDKLYSRVMVSMVSEELKMTDCGYANSIYVAESGFDMKTLERSEIIQILGIREKQLDSKMSVLANFMKKKYPFNGCSLRTVSTQSNSQETGYTLQHRLTIIDQQYKRAVINSTNNKDEIQNKRKLQQLQANMKKAYENDIERFKQFEAHSIKVKVGQQWRKKFEDYSRSISEEYRIKMDNLRKKQRLLSDDIVNKNKVYDEKVNETQKAFLQKIDLLDMKSSTLDETKKNLQTEKKRAKEEYQRREKQLKDKAREYDTMQLKLREKINYEVGVVKLAIQQQYQQKSAQFLARKKFVDEEYGKLMGIKDATDIIKEQNQRLHEENMQFRKDLTELEQQLRIYTSENASKSDRLDSLRSEVNKLERERNIKEDNLREQIKKCIMKEEELIQMRKQLDELRTFKESSQENSKERLPSQSNLPKSDLAFKIDSLKQQRLKEIEKLKMQL